MCPALFQNHSGGKSKGSGGEIYIFMIQPFREKSKFFYFYFKILFIYKRIIFLNYF